MITKLENNTIKLQCSPALWTKEPEYKKVTEIVLSYGGGIGGTSETIYVERVSKIKSNTIQSFIKTNGELINVNTSFVVKSKNLTQVTVNFKSLHTVFHKKGYSFGSKIYKEDILRDGVDFTQDFYINDGEVVSLSMENNEKYI